MINALVDLLGNFYQAGDLVHAEGIARSMLSAIPGDLVSLQFLGLVCHRTGRTGEALRLFQRAAERTHELPDFPHQADEHRCPQDEYAAEDVCYRAATEHPHLAPAWYDLGRTLSELGQRQLAISAFRSALLAQPGFAEALSALGDTGSEAAAVAWQAVSASPAASPAPSPLLR